MSGRCSFSRRDEPISVPPVPRPGDEDVELGAVAHDLLGGALVVRARVGRVAVLERHEEPVLGGELLGHLDGAVGAELAVGGDDLGAVERQQLAALRGDVLGHDGDELVAAHAADHRQRDAGVAGGRLHDRVAGADRPAPLGVVDQRERRAVLDRPGRVVALELGQDADVRVGRDVLQLDERRVADRGDQVRRDRRGRGRETDVASSRSAGHGREDQEGVAVRHLGVEPRQQPHVLVVEVDVDELVQLALGRLELGAHGRVDGRRARRAPR